MGLTVNVNGHRVFPNRYSHCCYGGFGYPGMINSCFGFGYGMGGFGYGMGNFCPGFGMGIGTGLGFAAGMALIPALPAIAKGIGKGCSWIGTNVIAPAATFTWNNVFKPVGQGIWSGLKFIGNGIAKGATAIGSGVAKLWNKIFHK